jgi:uncharacterized protein YdeI (YjbR/CyaY-like superfamily)
LAKSKIKTLQEKDLEIINFKSPKEFEKWLSKNYNSEKGIWLRFFKKDSEIKSLTYKEAVEEALCYGWIDGQAKSYDEKSWIQKFTPRRKKSIWSKINTERIEQLIKLGKMKPSGLKEVEEAKADGRWEKAYDSPSEMTIPNYFLKELSKNKKAKVFFETLNKTNKYSIAWRLQTAKKPETRQKRIQIILDMLSRGEKFHG